MSPLRASSAARHVGRCECELCRAGVTSAQHADASHDQALVQDFDLGVATLRIVGGTTKCARLALGYALAHPDAFRGRRVIELGSGAGLVAIGLAVGLGCDVDATDQAPVLELLDANIGANTRPEHHAIRTYAFQWGEGLDAWRGRHELIIGTDINFARENLAPLIATLETLARDRTQSIVLASMRRATWEDTLFDALAISFDAELLADTGDARLHRFVRRVDLSQGL